MRPEGSRVNKRCCFHTHLSSWLIGRAKMARKVLVQEGLLKASSARMLLSIALMTQSNKKEVLNSSIRREIMRMQALHRSVIQLADHIKQ